MFLRRKSGKAMSEAHLASKTGCGLNIGAWSMRSLLDNETGKRERRGREAIESKTGLCLAWVRREQKPAANDAQVRRPFHSDVQILRIRQ